MGVEALRAQLDGFEKEAFSSVRALAADSPEHLLAETELSRPISEVKLPELFSDLISELGPGAALRALWRDLPCCCALYIADAGRRKYEHGALYPFIAQELGFDYRYVTVWADKLLAFLDRVGLLRFWPDEAPKYKLESILLHGGLPDDAWDQVWRDWLLPIVRGGVPYRDAQDVINLALSDSHAAPNLRVTTRDILENGGSLVRGLIAHALQAAEIVTAAGYVDESIDYRLPPAALASLERILSAPKIRWPELVLDLSLPDPVTMRFSRQAIPYLPGRMDLEATYDVMAGVEGATIHHDVVPGIMRANELIIESTKFTPAPSSSYVALVRFVGLDGAGGSREKKLLWRSVTDAGIWSFARDRHGKYMCAPSGFRQRPFTAAAYLLPPEHTLETDGPVSVLQTTQLGGRWGGWVAWELEAPDGGDVYVLDGAGQVVGEWSLGRTCQIKLVDEDALSIGVMVGGSIPPRVYSDALPTVRIVPVDPGQELEPSDWSCCITWRAGGEKHTEHVPLSLVDRGFALEANLAEALEAMPSIVADGKILVDGPRNAGQLRRDFARVPLGRVRPVLVAGDNVLDCPIVTYELESPEGVLHTGRFYAGDDEAIAVRETESGYEIQAPLASEKITVKVRNGGKSVPLNLSLLGVTVEAVDFGPELQGRPRVPMALIERTGGGFIRVRARAGMSRVELVAISDHGHESVLRSVGQEGHYTDTLSLAELCGHAGLAPASLVLRITAPGVGYTGAVLCVVPGLGLGVLELGRARGGLAVSSETPALMSVELAVRDLTRPWREPASGLLEKGDTQVSLSPSRYPAHQGEYGLWARVLDEFEAAGAICEGEPDLVLTLGAEDEHDPPPDEGLFLKDLYGLLLFQQGLTRRPPSRSLKVLPRLGMLEEDARAAVWSAHSALRPGPENARALGGDMMRLANYRYALCPQVVRSLASKQFSECASRAETLASLCVLRLPVLPLRPENSGESTERELQEAWMRDSFLGLLLSQMHKLSAGLGRRDENIARAPALAWLNSLGIEDAERADLRGSLCVCRGSLMNIVEGREHYHVSAAAVSPLSRLFKDWHERHTTKTVVQASRWLSEWLDPCRAALQQLRAGHDEFASIGDLVHARDTNGSSKTVADLPLVTGVAGLVAAACAFRAPRWKEATACLAGGVADDVLFSAVTNLLTQAALRAPDLTSTDLTLIRMTAERMVMKELL